MKPLLWRGALSLLLVAGCRQVLDLEESHVAAVGSGSAAAANGGGDVLGEGTASGGTVGQGGAPSSAGTANTNVGGSEAPGGAGGVDAAAGADAGGSAGGTVDDDDGPPLCERYCAALAQNCTGDYQQYPDVTTCLGVCSVLPRGKTKDTKVNSVYCRLKQAEKAASGEPFFYCPMAGPGGAGQCGTDCEGYCQIMMGLCTEASTAGQYYFASKAACLEACSTAPSAGEPYSSSKHATGDHLQCRLFHACAAVTDPDYHCGHALGEPPCAPL